MHSKFTPSQGFTLYWLLHINYSSSLCRFTPKDQKTALAPMHHRSGCVGIYVYNRIYWSYIVVQPYTNNIKIPSWQNMFSKILNKKKKNILEILIPRFFLVLLCAVISKSFTHICNHTHVLEPHKLNNIFICIYIYLLPKHTQTPCVPLQQHFKQLKPKRL